MQGYTGLAKKVAIDHYFSGIAAPLSPYFTGVPFQDTDRTSSITTKNESVLPLFLAVRWQNRSRVRTVLDRPVIGFVLPMAGCPGFLGLPGSNSTRRLRHRSPAESNEKITPAVSLACEPLSAGPTATKALRDYLQNLRVQYLVNH